MPKHKREHKFCHDERHDKPCPEECGVCFEECDPALMLTPAQAKRKGLTWWSEADYKEAIGV